MESMPYGIEVSANINSLFLKKIETGNTNWLERTNFDSQDSSHISKFSLTLTDSD